MKKMTMTLFARTPVHVGAGNSVGAVDSPIQRERHTRIPIIPGSSLKGVLADLWNEKDSNGKWVRSPTGKELFGEDEGGKKVDGKEIQAKAGSLLIGEARVLAFPVRSAKGMFAWITCPLVLERFARDRDIQCPDLPALTENQCLSSGSILLENTAVLEEYRIESVGDANAIVELLKSVCSDSVWSSMPERLVVLSNDLFSYFVEQACEVVSRIRINDETGVVAKGALFNQEQVPSETLFYSAIFVDDTKIPDAEDKLKDMLSAGFLQVGGDASTGLGYCSVEVL
ncbi:type III-B CRISPR module RAMP protein Cmr4 [Verrucomicrobia bacterium S94]|nr:type III-B CRISPR module RAMP protein Cmr4 [Verrucomicrobia bacterium S94]